MLPGKGFHDRAGWFGKTKPRRCTGGAVRKKVGFYFLMKRPVCRLPSVRATSRT